jgi:hypothetical protein
MENVETVVENLGKGSSLEKLLSPRKIKSRNVGKKETVTNLMTKQTDPHIIVVPRGSTVSGTFTTTEQMTVHLPYRKSRGGRMTKRYSRSSKRKSKRTKKVRIV